MKFFLVFGAIFVLGNTADPLKQIANSNLKFMLKVYKLLEADNENFICSSLSAEIILSLLANGAKGESQKQLLQALYLPNNQKTRDEGFAKITTLLDIHTTNTELSTANKLYPQIGFEILESFKKNALNIYKSEIENINYENTTAAANKINEWVESKTNKKIKNLIDPGQLSPLTVLVLVNALYLKSKWLHPFEPNKTSKKPFYTSATNVKTVDMMYTDLTARYSKCNSFKAQILELDLYDNIAVGFILPEKGGELKGVESVLENYDDVNLKPTYIRVYLPRFEIETKIDFTTLLQKLGVETIFTNGADLSGISSQKGLKVSFVTQKAFINLTETGVEAAAATAVGAVRLSAPPVPNTIFKADHPFVYYIIEKKSNIILFVGRFQN